MKSNFEPLQTFGPFACLNAVPLVTLFIPVDRNCEWAGQWTINTDTETAKAIGAPFATEAEAVSAILQTGRWEPIAGQPSHFQPVP